MTTTPDTRPVVEIIANTLMALHRREPLEPTAAYRQARRIEKALAGADKLKGDPMTTTPNPTAEQGDVSYERLIRHLIAQLRQDAGDYAKVAQGIPMSHDLSWDARDVRAWDAATALEALLTSAAGLLVGDSLSAHANPLATSVEHTKNPAESSHVAPQEPSETDERVIAWEAVAAHPVLKPCYGEERPLLSAALDRLSLLADIEMTVNELKPAPPPGREKLLAEAEKRAKKRRAAGWLAEADMLDRLIVALAAQLVLDPEKVAALIQAPEVSGYVPD